MKNISSKVKAKYQNYKKGQTKKKALQALNYTTVNVNLPRTGKTAKTSYVKNKKLTAKEEAMRKYLGMNVGNIGNAYDFSNKLESMKPPVEEPPSTYVWDEEFPFNNSENLKEAKSSLPMMIRAAEEKPLGPFNERNIPTFENALNEVRRKKQLQERNKRIIENTKRKNQQILNLQKQIANMTSREARVKLASTPKVTSFSPISKFSPVNDPSYEMPPPIPNYR